MKRVLLAGLLMGVASTAEAAPITIGPPYAPLPGITFPQGAESFADEVVSYTPGTNVGVSGALIFNNPSAVLGLPNYNGSTGAVALGDTTGAPNSATLIVKFTNNSLTTSGNATPDLHIFEAGGVVEGFFVAISTDGINWIETPTAVLGQPTSIDIDALPGVVRGAQYSYVRLRDNPGAPQSGFPFAGPDIDAIGAISSTSAVPEPSTWALLGTGLAGLALRLRKRARRT